MQFFKFPMEYLRITQDELDKFSHSGSLAMDFGGKDTGSDSFYCPCAMKVKRVRPNANGEIYLESVEQVMFADGTHDYARLIIIHGDNRHLREGQVLALGEKVTAEGGWGMGNPNRFAKHLHIEGGKGKWVSPTQYKNASGVYIIERQFNLHKMFVLGDDVKIIDGKGHNWKRISDFETKPTTPPAVVETDVLLKAELENAKKKITLLETENSVLKNKLKTIHKESEV